MSLQNINKAAEAGLHIVQTNVGAYYKANYRYTSMQTLERYSPESKLFNYIVKNLVGNQKFIPFDKTFDKVWKFNDSRCFKLFRTVLVLQFRLDPESKQSSEIEFRALISSVIAKLVHFECHRLNQRIHIMNIVGEFESSLVSEFHVSFII